MRDLETIRLALEAAATGHLVFGPLHTDDSQIELLKQGWIKPEDAYDQAHEKHRFASLLPTPPIDEFGA